MHTIPVLFVGAVLALANGAGALPPGDPGGPADAGCGSQTITQSTDPVTIGTDSVWCGTLEFNADTQLARAFTAPYDLTLRCVTFGVRQNTGADWPCHVRILLGGVATPYASLSLLTETTVMIPAGTDRLPFTAELPPALLPAGTSFIVELSVPTRDPAFGGDGKLLSLGCNSAGESAPSYLRGVACGIDEYQTLASVGFGNRRLVLSLGVDAGLESQTLAGFPISAIGGALGSGAGEVVAVGDPTGGPIGLLIDCGDLTSGAGATFRAISEDERGATVAIEFRGAMKTDRLVFRDSAANPDDAVLDLEFDDPSFATFDMDIYHAGTYVGTLEGQTSGSVTFTDPGGGIVIWKWLKSLLGIKAEVHCETIIEYYESGGIKSKSTSYGGSVGTALVLPGGGGSGLVGDEFVLRPSAGLPGGGEPPIAVGLITTGIAGVALDIGADAPTVAIGAAETKLRPRGREFTTQVGASFKAIKEQGIQSMFATDLTGDGVADLIISPVATSPPQPDDGVIMRLGGVADVTVGMAAIAPDPAGACLTVAAESVGLPPVILSFDPWPPFPDFLAVKPDFTGTGTGQYTLQILDDAGTVLFEETGLQGIAGGSSAWPRKWGKLGGQTPCFTACYPDFTMFRTASGLEFIVHEIRVLAEGAGPAPLIDQLRITASSIGELHLFDPVTTLPSFGVVCYPDCDGTGALDFFDFLCFLNQFGAGEPAADCDGTGVLDFFDFLCFQNAFAAGCP